jgi:hypothetical protein
MLAVAYGRPIDKLPLAHPRRAVEKMREGDVASALMHLALTGLGKLSQPKEAAWRLLAAEGLMGSGVEPHKILPLSRSMVRQMVVGHRRILASPFSVVSSIVWKSKIGRSGENTSRTISYSKP